MQRTLVSFDTDRIKGYVFGTDKLKEIRGASAILDGLNREKMLKVAGMLHLKCTTIYANGGSGMFLVDTDEVKAEEFGQSVQREYRQQTHNGSSITYVVQKLPLGAPDNEKDLMNFNLHETLEWLHYKMRQKKDNPADFVMLSSHPFMRPCDACGVNYAEPDLEVGGKKVEEVLEDEGDDDEPLEVTDYYCTSCRTKRDKDGHIKSGIDFAIRAYVKGSKNAPDVPNIMEKPLWDRIIYFLRRDNYKFPAKFPRRPRDFNVFRQFAKSKEYLGLVYADGNNMGAHIETLNTLQEIKNFSLEIDKAIHRALSAAIKEHLPIETGKSPLFPFDVLLLGGDDLMIVTDSAKAMDVSLTIANKFHEFTGYKFTLSVGVILAPVKYPFSLLQDMAEQTLKAAKKGSSKARENKNKATNKGDVINDTRLSFLVIAGSSVHSYKRTLDELEKGTKIKDIGLEEFHATLRPYDPETLKKLLDAIAMANKNGINRSKLHQMREAILKMNLTSSVSDSLAAMRNWHPKQLETVVTSLYKIGMQKQYERQLEVEPVPFSDFPRVTIPWFYDGKSTSNKAIYRTSILDFIELYDFVHREDGNGNTAH